MTRYVIVRRADLPAGSSSYWPNWPMMNATCLQGNSALNILDPTRHDELADKDLVIMQSFNATQARLQSRFQNINLIKGIRGNGQPKICLYSGIQQTIKDQTSVGNSALEVQRDFIASVTEGNPNWYAHRVAPNQAQIVEPNFGQSVNRQCNMASSAGVNSLGESYVQTYWRKWDELLDDPTWNVKSVLDGVFQDNHNARPPDMWINNGATQVTDLDYNQNGIADGRADFSASVDAGGRVWAEGHLNSRTAMRLRFGSSFLFIPNLGQADVDYFDGDGQPPLPMSLHPFYHQYDVVLRESTALALGIAVGATSYSITTGAVSTLMRRYYMQEAYLRPDSQNTITGKGCVLLHGNCVDRTTPVAADYAYARFLSALPLLVERAGPCVQQSTALPLSLDECLLELGDPVVTRSMGTFNETTLSFTLRTPDQGNNTSGPKFHVARFAKGLVVARTDTPTVGPYPSADAAAVYTLPTPPAGKKYRHPNAATYRNPTTGRSMRGQDTVLNDGADATTASLKPYHAQFFELVAA